MRGALATSIGKLAFSHAASTDSTGFWRGRAPEDPGAPMETPLTLDGGISQLILDPTSFVLHAQAENGTRSYEFALKKDGQPRCPLT